MLKLSTKSSYAVRALVHLSKVETEDPQNLQTISKKENIPLPFLEQIFSQLKNAGIVTGVRGPNGGFKLAHSPRDITLAKIIATLEGPFEPILCSYPENKSISCHDIEGCTSRLLCTELDGAVIQVLTKKNLEMLAGMQDSLHPA